MTRAYHRGGPQLPGSVAGSPERRWDPSDHGRDVADPACSGPDVRALLARTREPFWALRLTPIYHGPVAGGAIHWKHDDNYEEDR